MSTDRFIKPAATEHCQQPWKAHHYINGSKSTTYSQDSSKILTLYVSRHLQINALSQKNHNYLDIVRYINALWPHKNHRATDPLYTTAIWWLVHWPLMGGVLHLVQRGRVWAGPVPQCTKCNSLPIKGQCTNFTLFDVALRAELSCWEALCQI